MSNKCSAIAQERRVGSGTKKAVLMYLADRASDDGSGIWTSKSSIAADTEYSKRSVQNAMNDFEHDGLITKTGTRKCKNGFTYEYQLNLAVLRQLPGTRDETGAGGSPVQEIHPTGAGGSPHGVQEIHPNHPRTIHEPSVMGDQDLFQDQISSAKPEPNAGDKFSEIWDAFPRKPNMPGKEVCKREYLRVLKQVSHEDLLRAVKAYAATREGEDPKFTSRLSRWLREGNYEGFLAAPEYRWEDLSNVQQRALTDGECPRSMMIDGQPNQCARYWLAKLNGGRQ